MLKKEDVVTAIVFALIMAALYVGLWLM